MTDPITKNGHHPAETDEPEDEWLTIAQAARRLGIDPKQARRYAEKLGEEDKRQDMSLTSPGHVLYRLAAVVALRAEGIKGRREIVGPEGAPPAREEDMSLTGPGHVLFQTVLAVAAVKSAYERQLVEQEKRLDELKAALEHERETSRMLADVLMREQAIRAAIPPPAQPEPEPSASRTERKIKKPAPKRRRWMFWRKER